MIDTGVVYWQMWPVLFGLMVAAVLYSWERWSLEAVSAGIVVTLILFFHFFPLDDAASNPSAAQMLAGFGNPALITILALLVVGQGMFHTAAIEGPAAMISRNAKDHPVMVFGIGILIVFLVSAFLNNTPLVVMFIPFVAAIAQTLNIGPSRMMMHLSFVCILAGMTTLIGSSTNLLVSDSLLRATGEGLGFFALTPIGLILSIPGLLYVVFVMNRLIPPRDHTEDEIGKTTGRQFVAQFNITPSHPLHGTEPVAGMFAELSDMTVRLIRRGERTILPPFMDIALKSGDSVVVATTRANLTKFLKEHPEYLSDAFQNKASEIDSGDVSGLVTFEAVVAPASRLISRTVGQAAGMLTAEFVVLGVQRRQQMIRSALPSVRLDAGDTLLILARRTSLRSFGLQRDLLPLVQTTIDIPDVTKAGIARLIFVGVIVCAATGALPILLASLIGALAMILTGCLNQRQALRSLDTRIFFLVGSALALGQAMEVTGAAGFLASQVTAALLPLGTVVLLSGLFLMVALLTNVISNSATAILFAPVALKIAETADLSPVLLVLTVIYAANCSFATPIAYQTNLLVMGPGRYRFLDFLRAGGPLVILIWVTYTGALPFILPLMDAPR
jgi:di/tricarboxylate transporter